MDEQTELGPQNHTSHITICNIKIYISIIIIEIPNIFTVIPQYIYKLYATIYIKAMSIACIIQPDAARKAISLRPKLVKQLFYAWQTRRSIYIARLFKHGTWMRVEARKASIVDQKPRVVDLGRIW
jgi:hypothetical protein